MSRRPCTPSVHCLLIGLILVLVPIFQLSLFLPDDYVGQLPKRARLRASSASGNQGFAASVYISVAGDLQKIDSESFRDVIMSLLNQHGVTTHLILSIPEYSLQLLESAVVLPKWLERLQQITVVRPPDYGNAAKYIAGLSEVPLHDSWVFVCEAERAYHPNLLKHMLDEAKNQPDAVWQNRGQIVSELGDGGPVSSTEGLLVPAEVLHRARAEHPTLPACFDNGDYWFGGFLLALRIPIRDTGVCEYSAIFASIKDGQGNSSNASQGSSSGAEQFFTRDTCARRMGCRILEPDQKGFHGAPLPCACSESGPLCTPKRRMVCEAADLDMQRVERVSPLRLSQSAQMSIAGAAPIQGAQPLYAAFAETHADREGTIRLLMAMGSAAASEELETGTTISLAGGQADDSRVVDAGLQGPSVDILHPSGSESTRVLISYTGLHNATGCAEAQEVVHLAFLNADLKGAQLPTGSTVLQTCQAKLPEGKATSCQGSRDGRISRASLVDGEDVYFLFSVRPLQLLKLNIADRGNVPKLCQLDPLLPAFEANPWASRYRGATRFVHGLRASHNNQEVDVFWSLVAAENPVSFDSNFSRAILAGKSFVPHLLAVQRIGGSFSLLAISCPLAFDAGTLAIGRDGRMVWPSAWSRLSVQPTSVIDFDPAEDLARVSLTVDDRDNYLVHIRGIGLWLKQSLEDPQKRESDEEYLQCFEDLPQIAVTSFGCLHSPQLSSASSSRWPIMKIKESKRMPSGFNASVWRVSRHWFLQVPCFAIVAPNGLKLNIADDGNLFLSDAPTSANDCWQYQGMKVFRSSLGWGPGYGFLRPDPQTGELSVSYSWVNAKFTVMPCPD